MQSLERTEKQEYRFVLNEDEYWDMNLTQQGMLCEAPSSYKLISFINLGNKELIGDECVISDASAVWDKYVASSGITFFNAGMTEVDNGHIKFDKNAISNDEFIKLYKDTDIILPEDGVLRLCKVHSNIVGYKMDLDLESNKFDGGFLQGYFKTRCNEYHVLPDNIDNQLTFSFKLSMTPSVSIDSVEKTLNNTHVDTNGIFFYIGTRSENKWWRYYNQKQSELEDGTAVKIREYSGLTEDFNYETEEGYSLLNPKIVKIETDNKHILYNRTPNGRVASEQYDSDTETISFDGRDYEENLHLLASRAKSGVTAYDIMIDPDKYKNGEDSVYSLTDDLYNNALAFRIKQDGSIGFRYLEKDCKEDGVGLRVVDEYSKPGLFRFGDDVWNKVTFRLFPVGNGMMRIYIYLGSSLVYVSRELQELNLRPLNDIYEKQELVPYTISLGGGTQGLGDVVYPEYKQLPEYELPLERYFAGTFIGKIEYMKIYEGLMTYNDVMKEHETI